MPSVEKIRLHFQQLSALLANPRVDALAMASDTLELEEVRHHLHELSDWAPPDETDVAIEIDAAGGVLHIGFEFLSASIYALTPHPDSGKSPLITTDLRLLVNLAKGIIATAFQVRIEGRCNPGLWDGLALPLNSQRLKYQGVPQGGLQGAGRGPDTGPDMLDLSQP